MESKVKASNFQAMENLIHLCLNIFCVLFKCLQLHIYKQMKNEEERRVSGNFLSDVGDFSSASH